MLMLRRIALRLWIVFALACIYCLVLDVELSGQAQSITYSNSLDAYDWGWLPIGVYDPGSVPICGFCVNAFDGSSGPDDGYPNRTVGIYRCDSVQVQELWAYDASTMVIISYNSSSEVLCIDSQYFSSNYPVLKLLPCNSTKLSQKWRKVGNGLVNEMLNSYLLGTYVSKNYNPANTNYQLQLLLNSSTPPSGFSSSTDFSFLSIANLTEPSNLTSSDLLLNTAGVVKASASSVGIGFRNGGFENSTIQAGGSGIESSNYHQNYPSYFSLCGWVTDTGPIDYVSTGYIPSAEGSFSIHLNTITDAPYWGSVSQTLAGLDEGIEYELSFSMAAFPADHFRDDSSQNLVKCYSNYTKAVLQLGVTNALLTGLPAGALINGTGFLLNISSSNITVVTWVSHSVRFKPRASSNLTRISFSSLNIGSNCGPMLDAVSLSRFKPNSNKAVVVGAVVAPLVAVSLVILGVLAVFLFRRHSERQDYAGLYRTEHARVFSSREIKSSTRRFSTVLGEGGFGTVYKADFPDGTVGAVKVEKLRGLSSSKKILASEEIAVLLRVHHRNLVNLIGFCIHRGRHMLVFEYLPNGSLHQRLHQSILSESFHSGKLDESGVKRKPLSWSKRVRIACDVAYGLEYLHHDANPPVVHRDVKSQNILLTANDSAKLADFGLSKAAPVDATSFQSVETMVRGSIGYLDPQYYLTGLFSAKSDVYSYGIVLLELVSGHQAIYNAASLTSWAAPFLTDPSLYHELVDKNLNGEFDREQLEALVKLSMMCTSEDGKQRPTMRQVVSFLSANHLTTTTTDSVESPAPFLTREEYHKLHPMFIDFEDKTTDELNTSSRENILKSMPHHQPGPRD